MSNCGICDISLKFGNTPLFGAGKIKSGETICLECFRNITKIESSINVKKLTIEEIIDKIQAHELLSNKIYTHLEKIGIGKSYLITVQKEIKELSNIISEGEEIYDLIKGTYNGGNGILVITNKRIVFIDKGLIYGLKIEDFGLEKITSIQIETGMFFADITILASGNVAKISNVEIEKGKLFCEKVRLQLSNYSNNINNTKNHSENIIDQLEKIATLKTQGIISDEEFTKLKNKILNL